jgi:chaperonin GroES
VLKVAIGRRRHSVAARLDQRKIHMTFRPLGDRVLIKRVEEEAKTRGGIIIPDTAKEKPQEGEVIAVGPGARDDAGRIQPLDVKPGDRILFGKWSGSEVKLDGQDLLIMKESDILGVLDPVKVAVAA